MNIGDVLYVPKLKKNLLSVGVLTSPGRGFNVLFEEDKAYIRRGNKVLRKGVRQKNNTYRLMIQAVENHEVNVTLSSAKIWHKQLGHIKGKLMFDM